MTKGESLTKNAAALKTTDQCPKTEVTKNNNKTEPDMDEVMSTGEEISTTKHKTENETVNEIKEDSAVSAKKEKLLRDPTIIGNSKHTLLIRDIPSNFQIATLKKHFGQFGTVTQSFLSKKKLHDKKGFAFITYATEEEMEAALKVPHIMNGNTLTATISVEKAVVSESLKRKREDGDSDGPPTKKSTPGNAIFVGGLGYQSTVETVKQYFSTFGSVVDVHIPLRRNSPLNKGFAFVAFDDAKGAQAAVAEKKHEIDSRTVAVSKKNENDAKSKSQEDKNKRTRNEHELFVGTLDKNTVRKTLEEHFSKYGTVVAVTLPMTSTSNTNKGFAFVAYEDQAGMDAALAAEHVIDDADVDVRRKESRSAKREASSKRNARENVPTPTAQSEAELEHKNDEEMEEADDGEQDDEEDGDE